LSLPHPPELVLVLLRPITHETPCPSGKIAFDHVQVADLENTVELAAMVSGVRMIFSSQKKNPDTFSTSRPVGPPIAGCPG